MKAARPITVRDLLTHTSGFGYGTGVGGDLWTAAGQTGYYFADKNETIRDSVRRIASLPAHAQPGDDSGSTATTPTSWARSSRSWPANRSTDVLRERIFEPLGMRDTEFYLSPGKENRLTAVYSQNAGKLERAPAPGTAVGQGHYVDGPRKNFSGGAGLLSTATDYARFLQMMLNGGELDGRRILSRKTVELMTTSHLGDIAYNAGQGFGLGFYVVEDVGARGSPGSEGEFGWGGAYHTTYWVDPREELVVVHLTQLVPAGDVDDQAKVRALVYQAIVGLTAARACDRCAPIGPLSSSSRASARRRSSSSRRSRSGRRISTSPWPRPPSH